VAERLLMIEDDAALAALVRDYLKPLGYDVTAAATATEGLRRLQEGWAAVLLDVMLPDLDGFEVCRRIRAGSDLPVLMLTARGQDEDRIVGLELGADDYLPKPFNPRELAARLRAILRRRGGAGARGETLRFGRLEIAARPRMGGWRGARSRADSPAHALARGRPGPGGSADGRRPSRAERSIARSAAPALAPSRRLAAAPAAAVRGASARAKPGRDWSPRPRSTSHS
jgi:CheY-like chemotaxis protein